MGQQLNSVARLVSYMFYQYRNKPKHPLKLILGLIRPKQDLITPKQELLGLRLALVNVQVSFCIGKICSLNMWGGGGGANSIYPWVARGGAAPHTLTLFKTNIATFNPKPYPT